MLWTVGAGVGRARNRDGRLLRTHPGLEGPIVIEYCECEIGHAHTHVFVVACRICGFYVTTDEQTIQRVVPHNARGASPHALAHPERCIGGGGLVDPFLQSQALYTGKL